MAAVDPILKFCASAHRATKRLADSATGSNVPGHGMITNRHRGLVRIYGFVVLLTVAGFFLVYAELVIFFVSDVVRLTREVNLLPYFLCVLIGLLAGLGRILGVESRLARLTLVDAAGLATTQAGLVALAVFSMMFATQDTRISRLFLGTFLLWCWLGLVWMHRTLPRVLASLLYGQEDCIPTLFIGRSEAQNLLNEWMSQRRHLGMQSAGFVALDALGPDNAAARAGEQSPLATAAAAPLNAQPAPWSLDDLSRVLEEKNISQVILLELP